MLAAGGVTVPVYPTNSSSQVAYVLSHSGCRFLFVEDLDQLSKVLLRRDELPDLERVFVFDRGEGLDHDFVGDLTDLDDLAADELAVHPTVLDDRARALHPDDMATIVYTSGTTGRPKGAVLTHGNIAANIDNITRVVPIGPDDRFLSFLPLSHIAERTVSDFGEVLAGGETWFAESLASVQQDLQACRPTIFFAVPRVWEKFREGVRREGRDASRDPSACWPSATCTWWPARVASPARARSLSLFESGAVQGARRRSSAAPSAPSSASTRPGSCVSGAAPVHPDLLRWFHGLGLPVAEVYGQTENCGVSTVNPPGRHPHRHRRSRRARRRRSASPTTARSSCKGANVTPGYHRDEVGTAELIDPEGWMHTGDLGALDADGYLTHHRPQEGPHHQRVGQEHLAPGDRDRGCATSR